MKKDRSLHSPSLFDTCKDNQFSIPGVVLIESKGKILECLYDPEHFELVSRYRWNLHNKGYAVTNINGKQVLMHRLILGVVDTEIQVDHKHHNKLDNRTANLRVCTPSENRRNSQKHKENAHSNLKGIYLDRGRWHAQISMNGKVKNLGRYRSDFVAARVYDRSARLHHKEFAYLNFPEYREHEQLLIQF